MPIFDYECQECGHIWEEVIVWNEPEPTVCPINIKRGGPVDSSHQSGQFIKRLPGSARKDVSWSRWRAVV